MTNSKSATGGVKNIGDTIKIAYKPNNLNDCIFITPNNKSAIITAFILGIIYSIFAVRLLVCYCVRYKERKKQNKSKFIFKLMAENCFAFIC